ncbi:MAG: hypothetical protein IJC51_04905, partial [Eggerthellaceae bacterium]|nr:hypothetical protein [Eggerthellaceae bacterium]
MPPKHLWNKTYVTLLAIELAMQFGMYLTRPIVSSFALALGATLGVAGLIAGLNATAAMAMRPLTGLIADTLSKRRLLVASCAIFIASAVGCATAVNPITLGLFCGLQGVAFAFRTAVIGSMIALAVPSEKLATGMGWM